MRRQAMAAMALVLSTVALSQDKPVITIERESIWRSRYVWRGLVLEPDGIYETSTTFGSGNAWFNLWTYQRGPEALWHRSAREVDFTLGWDLETGGWSLTPSVTYYSFPNGWEDRGTAEIALETSRDLGGNFSLLANLFLDVSADRGASFLELGLGYERDLGGGWSLDASAIAGRGDRKFNASNFEVARAAWNAAYGEIGLSRPVGRGWSARASVSHSRTLDRRFRDESPHPESTVWSFSLTYSK